MRTEGGSALFSITTAAICEVSSHCLSEPRSPERPPVSPAFGRGHLILPGCVWTRGGTTGTAPQVQSASTPQPAALLRTHLQEAPIWTKPTATTAMSYSPRILRGRRHFGGLFQTVPLSHPSFQEICHRSDECPLIRAMGHCKSGWHAQCARRGVCCTVRNQQKHSHYKPSGQPGAHPS